MLLTLVTINNLLSFQDIFNLFNQYLRKVKMQQNTTCQLMDENGQ